MKNSNYKLVFMSFISLYIWNNLLYAADGIRIENPQYNLKLKHLSGEILLDNERTVLTKVTSNRPTKIKLKRGSAVSVEIIDTNPILFTYNENIEIKDSQDYLKFKKFLSELKGVLDVITKNEEVPIKEAKKMKANDTPITVEAEQLIAMSKLLENITELEEYYDEQKEIIDLTIGSSEEIKSAKEKVADWKLDQLKINIADMYKKAFFGKQNNTTITFQEAKLLLDKEKVDTMLSSLKKFANTVLSLPKIKYLDSNIEINDTRKEYQMTIITEPNIFYSALLSDKAKKHQLKYKNNLKLYFERESYVKFSVTAGVIHSFVDNPKFEVKEDDNGNRSISKSSNAYNALNGAVMLNIIPEHYFESSFEPYIQLGASTNTDNVGILLGIGLSILTFTDDGKTQRSLNLSAGGILQEVEKLEDGLSVGDNLTTDSELKTKKDFKKGLYIMLGINF